VAAELPVSMLPVLRDVDVADVAAEVAGLAPTARSPDWTEA
jgi:hypothetical protein